MQCLSHSGRLSGKLAIIMTDDIRIDNASQDDASRFTPGTSINWVPLSNGSCTAIILANLRLAGYDETADRGRTDALRGMPAGWLEPNQFVEARYLSIRE